MATPNVLATTPAGSGGGVTHVALVAGAAAGDVTVTGMTAAATIKSVTTVADTALTAAWCNGVSASLPHTYTVAPIGGGAALGVTDVIKGVYPADGTDAVVDYTAHFASTPAGTNQVTQNDGSQLGTANEIVVVYHPKLPPATTDLTSEFTAATDKINNTGGTSSAGKSLVVVWTAAT